MCVLGEHFIADGVFVLIFFILGPMHLHQLSKTKGTACDGASLIHFDEICDVDALEYVPFYCADRIFKGREGEGAAVERKFGEGYFFDVFFSFPIFSHFCVGEMHFIFGVPMFAHLF